ncbi:Glucosamine-6-phosphate deaminase (GlcN6P deaminase) (GNPDA) (Glucosamine-6-phosphate isomerase) [Durusdinium trenchii]|uniref:Glucosamine-6-phosphate deaminase (GlcN6P deaminase) (GNPDA) (Glucosamine-6-phosphate isomerase) n=1 Tax=Durusdinium trenchii TaxID=1381693 RepID=A0ABP0IT30_9DINO
MTKRKLEDAVSSSVEAHLVSSSPYQAQYEPEEKISTVVVENFPMLGKASAWRFLEWAQGNPEGVCSLPTGKTPEYFIKWVQRILKEWNTAEMQAEAKKFGLSDRKPVLDKLTFVQIDEFYPISPQQHNSFHYYVNEYYIKGFGLDPSRALLMDCSKIGLDRVKESFGPTGEPQDHLQMSMEDIWSDGRVDLTLRTREPTSRLERLQQRVLRQVDQWCAEYEGKIRALGGIGFFMGGIGPDGHVAFNCQGCDHFSTTRLDELNYPSQAAAAGDLGGIEAVRKRKVITIGLGTVTFNPRCVALICAAGEAKAQVVKQAVEEDPHVNFPATALHKLPRACFFLTSGAAKLLSRRQLALLETLKAIDDQLVEKALVSLCCQRRKRLLDLTATDLSASPFAAEVLRKAGKPLKDCAEQVRKTLIQKIERGCQVREKCQFLHTEPHHDDIMLGYLPAVLRSTRVASNQHHFVCATSGFNSVSNKHMLMLLQRVERFSQSPTFQRLCAEKYFSADAALGDAALDFRRRDVWKFLDGIAAADDELRDEGAARRLVFNLCQIFGESLEKGDSSGLLQRVQGLKDYFHKQYAGQKDEKDVQTLKGSCREFEAECVWGYIGWQLPNISHLRLGFYTADIFAPEPTQQRDVLPVLKLLKNVQPDVVTVALDPEASGPDTHYKVLQAVTSALQQHAEETKRDDITVWGYRNVWFRFEPHEVSTIIPVSLQTISTLNHMFLNSFESQRHAEFPAYEIQGPFCAMSQRVQVEQYDIIETCLGYEWFHKHPSPLIRATRGLVFLREMSVEQLLAESRALRQQTENLS